MQPTTVTYLAVALISIFAISHAYNVFRLLDTVMVNIDSDDFSYLSILIGSVAIIGSIILYILSIIFVADSYGNVPVLLQFAAASCMLATYLSYFKRFSDIG